VVDIGVASQEVAAVKQSKLEIVDNVATITMNKPPDNRFGLQMMDEFDAALDEIIAAKARAMILAADGPDFCHGGDILGWPEMPRHEILAMLRRYNEVAYRVERLPIPVIAAVQGLCNGGGYELALRTDLIFATRSARFSNTEQQIGYITGIGGAYRSAERAGRQLAYEWLLTSEEVPADVMLHHGVVNRVVDEADLLTEVTEFARKVAKGPALVHAAHKQLLRYAATNGIQAADDAMVDLFDPLIASYDLEIGMKSAVDVYLAGGSFADRPQVPFEGR
jgi:enoyl-CoA hydratase/carnithine racemase